jgi:hypothetical protein
MSTKIKSSNLDENLEISGTFTANNIVGVFEGNADTATALETPRTITIGSTGKPFDGSADVSWSLNEIGVGTLGEQNANNAVITGGSINGTAIGASSASTGVFTSLTTPLVTNAGTLALSATGANIVTASTNGVERLRIDSAGNVLVGKTSTGLGVGGIQLIPAGQSAFSADNGQTALFINHISPSGTQAAIQFRYEPSTVVGSIATTSTATSYNTSGTSGLIGVDAGTVALRTNNGERLRIDSAGNVGIGTSAPTTKLHVDQGADSNGITLAHSGRGPSRVEFFVSGPNNEGLSFRHNDGSDSQLIYSASRALHAFSTAGSERLRIDSAGNVGIGTSSPDSFAAFSKNLVVGNAGGSRGITINSRNDSFGTLSFANPEDSDRAHIRYMHGDNSLRIRVNSAERLRITSAGNVGIGTSNPTNTRLKIGGSLSGTAGTGLLQFAENNVSYWNFRLDAGSANLVLDRSFAGWQTTPVLALARNTGRVGIGTSAPQSVLHIEAAGASESSFRMKNTGAGGGDFSLTPGIAGLSNAGFSITDNDASATRLHITSAGNVGIGTSSASVRLRVLSPDTEIAQFLSTNASNTGEITIRSNGGIGNNTRGRIVGGFESGGSNYGGFLAFNTTTNQNINAERLRITSAGNVGIGTSAPTSILSLGGNTNTDRFIHISGTRSVIGYDTTLGSAGALLLQGGNKEVFIDTGGQKDILLFTNNTERMRITSAGNVGIGTSAPADRLDVAGNARVSGRVLKGTQSFNTSSITTVNLTNIVVDNFSHNLLTVSAASGATNSLGAGMFLVSREGSSVVIDEILAAPRCTIDSSGTDLQLTTTSTSFTSFRTAILRLR